MNDIILLNNFYFYNLKFTKYHYTDNRKGSPLNYLAYMIKGRCRIVSPDRTIMVNEGDVFFIPKNISYQSFWFGDSDIELLSFGFLEFDTKENLSINLQKIECDSATKSHIMNIPTEGNAVSCKALSIFYGVLAEIMPTMEYQSLTKNEQIIKKSKNYIMQNLNCTMSEVARVCYISEPYLYTIFKHELNTTPNEFRQSMLCEKGIELLTTTDKTVEEISGILNISSASYFRKILKKHTGKTPREIRKNSII